MKDMKKHGVISLVWQGKLLLLYAYGPFNEEGIEAAICEAKKRVINRQVQRWSRLEILDDETLGSLAVLAKVNDLYLWFEENGCEHTAVVVSNCVQTQVVELFDSKAKVFSDISSAKTWLREKACQDRGKSPDSYL